MLGLDTVHPAVSGFVPACQHPVRAKWAKLLDIVEILECLSRMAQGQPSTNAIDEGNSSGRYCAFADAPEPIPAAPGHPEPIERML
jgi:hypothetical protein